MTESTNKNPFDWRHRKDIVNIQFKTSNAFSHGKNRRNVSVTTEVSQSVGTETSPVFVTV